MFKEIRLNRSGRKRTSASNSSTAAVFSVERLEERVQLTVPGTIISPVNGTGWNFNAHGTGLHTEAGGIGGADDRQAWDANLNTPTNDSDKGKPVFAIADGWIERNIKNWSGDTAGQLLLKHFNPDGSVYYSGYLHMSNRTDLRLTQGAYVRGGTQVGNVSNVGVPDGNNHLHFAIYEWDGTKLRSKSTTLLQANERPNLAVVGTVKINNQAVNQSLFPVSRNRSFTMDVTVRNNGSQTMTGNFYVILTRDQAGSQYVGKVGDAGMTANMRAGTQSNLRFTKSSFSSPAGDYYLQLYYAEGSGVGGALKRVSGINPISIRLQ